jgi:hypothetical protein
MAARKWSGDKEEGFRNCVESVLDRDNECSDFSEDETESEVSSIGNDDESSDEDSDEKMMTRRALLNVFELQRRTKQSDWKWTKTDSNPLIPPSELSIFLEYMEPLFEKICQETVSTQECSWTIQTERSWQMMKNGLTQHIPSTEKKEKWQEGVLCARAGAKGVKVFGSANTVGLPFI